MRGRLLWTVVLLLCIIGMAASVRRTVVLLTPVRPAGPPDVRAMDAVFAAKPTLSLLHIIPGFFFLALAPLQFAAGFRRRHIRAHRWLGRGLVITGAVTGATAIAMSFRASIGGMNETAATVMFGLLFLFSLCKAFLYIRHRQVALHREWMIRAFAIALAIATVRPIVGLFFATSRLTGLTLHDFFGTAFWIGFTLHLVAAEAWINRTRSSAKGAPP
jgi:hypothetical protein